MWCLVTIPQISYQWRYGPHAADEAWHFSMAGTQRVNLLAARNGLLAALDGAHDVLVDAERRVKMRYCLRVSIVHHLKVKYED